ncbi:hypothetical protein ABZ618_25295 [Streptomyces roseolus]|uniref:hypothetical protein n=1 Tax=Streptomyces roseolus TaxID=67358 RepID=UPI0033D36394
MPALVAVGVLAPGLSGVGNAAAAGPAHDACRSEAEVFATDDTAITTDPADPRPDTRIVRFEREVRGILRAHGARPGASTLLEGVFPVPGPSAGDVRALARVRRRRDRP